MNRRQRRSWALVLWGVFILTLAGLAVFLLSGCADQPAPKVPAAELLEMTDAASCKLAIDRYRELAHTCEEFQWWSNADKACAKFAPLDFRCHVREP